MRILTKQTLKALILDMQKAVKAQDQGLADKVIEQYKSFSDEDNFIVVHNMKGTKGDTVNEIYFKFAVMVPERSIYRRSIAHGEKVMKDIEHKGYIQNECADRIEDNDDFVQYLLEIDGEITA